MPGRGPRCPHGQHLSSRGRNRCPLCRKTGPLRSGSSHHPKSPGIRSPPLGRRQRSSYRPPRHEEEREPWKDPTVETSPVQNPQQEPTHDPRESPTQGPTQDPTQDPGEYPTDPTQDPREDPTQDSGEDPEDPTQDPEEDPDEDPTQDPGEDPDEDPDEDPLEGSSEGRQYESQLNPENNLRMIISSRSQLSRYQHTPDNSTPPANSRCWPLRRRLQRALEGQRSGHGPWKHGLFVCCLNPRTLAKVQRAAALLPFCVGCRPCALPTPTPPGPYSVTLFFKKKKIRRIVRRCLREWAAVHATLSFSKCTFTPALPIPYH
ncbi:suspected latency associated binding domain protein [Saguinine gammaherpesvirus 1]|uniref:Suspected latency associated binding domain protein n=1 Tax=Saguinine gammaherpesvirus 1 TaxID=2169901 RepID=A0A9Q8QWY5_9GAMA|nr:suspected latency associated binding domain protein [Saguinine gammaherpesvirus 1]